MHRVARALKCEFAALRAIEHRARRSGYGCSAKRRPDGAFPRFLGQRCRAQSRLRKDLALICSARVVPANSSAAGHAAVRR